MTIDAYFVMVKNYLDEVNMRQLSTKKEILKQSYVKC